MKKEEMITLLSEWNFWKKEMETGKERENYLKQAISFLKTKTNKVLIIIGVRRSGKSFITKQIIKNFISEGLDPKSTLIVNFEEVRFDEELSLKLLLKIYDSYKRIIKPQEKPLIVLDEIQEIERWEKFVRTLQEKDEARVIISGSSSKLMSEELATLLTGRTLQIEVFPLSFKEFLFFREFEIKDLMIRKKEVLNFLDEYMEFGGFPEVVVEENKEVRFHIIKKYYEDIIIKDVIRRYRIKNVRRLEVLANYYLTNFSSPITFNKISKFLHLPLKTVEVYSKYLEVAKLLFFLQRFSFSLKERENSPRKVYGIDIGLINAISFRFMENLGKLYENLVGIELLRRGKEIYYWKDYYGREVDFVLKEGLQVKQLIQVCYDIDEYATKEREIKAILKASKELKCKNLLIITEDYEETEEHKGKKIKFIPLWKWLLFPQGGK